MTAPKLKPCPFCGGEASHNGGGGSVFGRFWWTVGCKACGVWFADPEVWSNTGHGMLDPAYPPKHCFAAWNTRANLHDATKAQLAECEARLRKAVEALIVIDALDPEGMVDGCSQSALRGLVTRMGQTARAALVAVKESK